MEVAKADPRQVHDVRSLIEEFRAWEIKNLGADLTYTAHYSVQDSLFVRRAAGGSAIGVSFGTNAYDLAFVNSKAEGYGTGVKFLHKVTDTVNNPDGFFLGVDPTSTTNSYANVIVAPGNGMIYGGDLKIHPVPPSNPPTPTFTPSWGNPIAACYSYNGPCWAFAPGKVWVKGTKSDSVTPYPSSVPFPTTVSQSGAQIGANVVQRTTNITEESVRGILAAEGYYTNGADHFFIVWPEYIADRMTGQIELTAHVVGLDKQCDDVPYSSVCGDFSTYQNLGQIQFSPTAPTAGADPVVVPKSPSTPTLIDVLSNDASNVTPTCISTAPGCLRPTGLTAARWGDAKWVVDNGVNKISYTPHPGLPSGSLSPDTFYYWVRDSQGRPAKGAVTVTLN